MTVPSHLGGHTARLNRRWAPAARPPGAHEARSMKALAPIAVAAGLLFGSPAARGQLIAYDGFAYPTGSLAGQNGGTGFSSPWTVITGTVNVASGSLTPAAPSSGLATTGNSISVTGSFPGHQTRPLTVPQGVVGNTVWLSAVMKGTGSTGLAGGGSVSLTNGGTGGFSIVTGTTTGPPSANWSISDANSGSSAASSTIPNTLQSLLVARVVSGTTTDVIDLFVNPPLTGTPPATANATLSLAHAALTNIDVSGASLSGGTNLIDEVRLGNTFADVTPVPEPSAVALLGLAAIGAAARQRRFSRGPAPGGRRTRMIRTALVLACSVLFACSRASAQPITYYLQDYPAYQNGRYGTTYVSGTITTDGTIGALSASNILSTSYHVINSEYSFSSSTMSVSQIAPGSLTATPTQLLENEGNTASLPTDSFKTAVRPGG